MLPSTVADWLLRSVWDRCWESESHLEHTGFLLVRDWGGGWGQTVIPPVAQRKLNLVVRSVGFDVLHIQAPVPASLTPPTTARLPEQASVSSSDD